MAANYSDIMRIVTYVALVCSIILVVLGLFLCILRSSDVALAKNTFSGSEVVDHSRGAGNEAHKARTPLPEPNTDNTRTD